MVIAAVLAAGCGPDGSTRLPVEGRIRGAEGRRGLVAFLPTGGPSGRPSANTALRDGRFAFTRRNGPFAGEHRVVVRLSGGPAGGTDGQTGGGRLDSGKGSALAAEGRGAAAGWDRVEHVIEGVRVPEQGPWLLELTLPGAED